MLRKCQYRNALFFCALARILWFLANHEAHFGTLEVAIGCLAACQARFQRADDGRLPLADIDDSVPDATRRLRDKSIILRHCAVCWKCRLPANVEFEGP